MREILAALRSLWPSDPGALASEFALKEDGARE